MMNCWTWNRPTKLNKILLLLNNAHILYLYFYKATATQIFEFNPFVEKEELKRNYKDI